MSCQGCQRLFVDEQRSGIRPPAAAPWTARCTNSRAQRCSAKTIGLRPRSAGFTLIEILLVLTVLVLVGSLAWQSVQHGLDNFKIKRAADQVVTAFGRARVKAMSKGLTEVFRFEPNTPRYTIEAMPDDTAPVDADSAGSSAGPATSSGGGNASGASAGSLTGQLPDDYVFTDAQRVLDNRTAAAESQLSSSGAGSQSPPVLFFPDGTSSEATVTVADKNGLSITVSVRGLTSFARVGNIVHGEKTTP